MPYDESTKVLFIHIPKTAGKSVETLLNIVTEDEQERYKWRTPLNRAATLAQRKTADHSASKRLWGVVDMTLTAQHLTYAEIDTLGLLSQQQLQECRSFTVVRHPYTRAVSTYRHFNSKRPSSTTQGDISAFIANFAESRSQDHGHRAHQRQQWEFCVDPAGINRMTAIVRFENLHEELQRLTARWNLPSRPLPHIGNQASPRERGPSFTDEFKETIIKYFEKDFEFFGFER